MGPSSASHSGSTDVTHCMNLIKGVSASFGRTQTHSTAIRGTQEALRRQSGGTQMQSEALRRHSASAQQRAIIIISVLLGSHHELVVDNVLGLHAHPVECRRRVQVARHARAHVQVLRDRLHARGVLEVG